jgi:aerobic carbon-monoxide dehydrogenase medium subunit
MYPPRFDYLAPRSVEEALDVLAERGDDAKVLAGGQSLIPLLKLRFAAPEVLVDINRLPGLDTLSEENGWLRIGPLVRHRDAERSTLLREHYPTMAAAAPQISDPLVRNLGTVCGSLAHADPSGDWGAVMIAMGAELLARSARGERAIPVRELFTGPFTTTLEPDELVTGVRVPSRQRTGGSYLKLERKVGDFATAAVAVRLTLGQDGRIAEAGIGLTAVGPTNLAATAAEDALRGAAPDDEAFRGAGELAAQAASPGSDLRGTVDYKRNVIRTFTERGLRNAAAIAANNQGGA